MENQIKPIAGITSDLRENLFLNAHYYNKLALYVNMFNAIPNDYSCYDVNIEKFHKVFIDEMKDNIVYHQYSEGENDVFSWTYILKDDILIFIGDCVRIFFKEKTNLVESIIKLTKKSKNKQKNYLNIIVADSYGLTLKAIDVNKPSKDISKYYNDDFEEYNKIIRTRLNKKNDKGIVLLHGKPGTGKTSYLRYLIHKVQKRVMFLPSNLAHNITDPSFLSFLVNYPNSILIIEDAENVIKSRTTDNGSSGSISNLLNLSDGLLSDCLNIQIICTFNSDIGFIDDALLRKGRLIAKYEFNELSIDKAQVLSDQYGFDTKITSPMTLTDIINQNEKQVTNPKISKIGFLN